MGYQEITGATSRKINPDFATHKIVIQEGCRTRPGGLWESIKLYKHLRGLKEEGEEGSNKAGVDRKIYKRDRLHVKWGWSAHGSGWSLHLITAVCPFFLLNLSLTLSPCIVIVLWVCVLQGLSASCWWYLYVYEWKVYGGCYWSLTRGVGTPVLWCQ